uniref:Structural maintenance of chromosomes protein 5 n=1 Tax=Meloidogyne enterolobii TaxID=390850 RepID=A0A6V7VLL7_MELEN|nr:unnamed protein product [Meloidogyne enterolobii]
MEGWTILVHFLPRIKLKVLLNKDLKNFCIIHKRLGQKIYSRNIKNWKKQSVEGSELQNELDQLIKRGEQVDLELKTKKQRADAYKEWAARNRILNLLEIKKSLIEYQNKLDTLKEASERVDIADRQVNESKAQLEPVNKSIKNVEATIESLEKEIGDLRNKNKTATKNIEDALRHNSLDEKLQKAADTLKKVQNTYAQWDKEKESITKEYDKYKNFYETLSQKFSPDENLPKLKDELYAEHAKIKKEELEITEKQTIYFRLDNQLHSNQNSQRNSMETKLRNLVKFRNNPAIPDAWEFYTKNREKFRGQVYVPYLDVHIPNANNLVLFNNVVASRDLGIFIFSCSQDEELLINKFKIDSSIVSQEMIQNFEETKVELSSQLGELGFVDFLLNLFKSSSPVGAYLNGLYSMDKLLIGGQKVEENYERICQAAREINPEFQLFLTRQLRIEVYSSRHNPKKIYVDRKTIIYNNPRFDMEHTKSLIDVDNELKKLQEDKEILKERQEKVAQAKEDFKRRGEEYREKMKKEKEKSDEIKRYRDHAAKCKDKLSQYSKEKPNLEAAQAAYNEASNKILETAIGDFEKIVDSMENQRDPINTIAINCDEHARLKSRLKQLKAEKDFFDQIHQTNKEDFQQKLKSRVEAKEEVEYRKSVFKQVAECSPPGSGGEVTNDDKRKFEKILKEFEEKQIPDDLESIELKNAEERKKSSKDRQDGTEKDADEYEKFLKEREILVKNIRLATEKNDRWKNKMDTELASWLEQLRPMIDSINEKFSQFFATLGCVGEVRFDEPENKYSISEYGIKIMVKFRNGTCLRELNPQTQSGGERSVSTMLYIMALQNLCFVPFRCVDEINQGMDPNNERAVFNMMVKLLDNNEGEGGGNNNNKTQYFLLTPKLLNGLQFNERVTVHVVHNGPAIENPLDWDPQRFLRR